MESIVHNRELESCQRRLGLRQSFSNTNSKIWAFVDDLLEVEIVGDEEQVLRLHILNQGYDIDMCITLVYVKCTIVDRLPLWESLYNLSEVTSIPWMVGGDFNVIRCEEEKLGGRPVTKAEIRDFNHCIATCNLEDASFQGNKYTWWNERIDEQCIFKRLDRVLYNEKMQDLFPVLEVKYLLRDGSDHAQLLLNVDTVKDDAVRPFRFLKF